MSYNGWKNYETWCTALWIDNEESTYHERQEMAERASDDNALAESLKQWVNEMAPDLGPSLFSDLLSAALSEVDWDEIANAWHEEAHEDDEPEEDEAESSVETSE